MLVHFQKLGSPKNIKEILEFILKYFLNVTALNTIVYLYVYINASVNFSFPHTKCIAKVLVLIKNWCLILWYISMFGEQSIRKYNSFRYACVRYLFNWNFLNDIYLTGTFGSFLWSDWSHIRESSRTIILVNKNASSIFLNHIPCKANCSSAKLFSHL